MKRLFRDQTKAWIESPGPVHWLDDGTFLWLSERDGWKHIYHYDAGGQPEGPAHRRARGRSAASNTSTPRTAGSTSPATRDNPMATNFYRTEARRRQSSG